MEEHFFFPVFGVLFIIALLALALIRSHLSESRKIQLRAIQKEERMKAIEAGVPLPEIEEPIHSMTPYSDNDGGFARRVKWLRFVSLATGYFLLFGGLGFFMAFSLVSDRSLQEIAEIGFLPALAGLGLLLFYWVTRNEA